MDARIEVPQDHVSAMTALQDGRLPEKESCVLVIDDEAAVREIVADMLQEDNVGVLAAEDGEAGVELFRAHKEKVRLVLLDYSMPGLNGEETCRRLKTIDPHARVVLTSGYSQEEAVRAFSGLGLAGFIQKPFVWSQFSTMIAGLIA